MDLNSFDQVIKAMSRYCPGRGVVSGAAGAVDSVKLGLVICLIARSIRVGMGLNPHKVWSPAVARAESACVKSYD